MSWGRQDDGYWEHPKTKALVELGRDGLAAAGAFWIINSYCNRMHRPTFSIWEASMLLRVQKHEAESILLPLTVAPEGFERGFVLAEQDGSYEINSFEEYRSKSEAKVLAGSKGGKKAAESRRGRGVAESEQTSSRPVAESEQGPSPDPDPGSRSRIPIPDPGSRSQQPDRESDPSAPISLREVADLGFKLGTLGGANEAMIRRLEPLHREEVELALRTDGKSWKYFAKVVEGIRDQRAKPQPPGYQPPRQSGSGPRRPATTAELDAASEAFIAEGKTDA